MLWTGSIWRELDPGKAKHEPDQLLFQKGADEHSTVMDRSDQHMGRDNIRFTTRPDGALQSLDGAHFFGRFKDSDQGRFHGQRVRCRFFWIFSERSEYQGLRAR